MTLIGPAGSDLMLADLGQRFHVGTRLPLGATGAPMPAAEPLLPQADVAPRRGRGRAPVRPAAERELTERGARLVGPAKTAPRYRLFALPGTTPPKPGLVRAEADAGHAIDVEVWELPMPSFGGFVAGIPAPLSIGTIELGGRLARCRDSCAKPPPPQAPRTSRASAAGATISTRAPHPARRGRPPT